MSEQNFYLEIDGQSVKVSEEVYREYKRAEEKERYFMRRLKKGRFLVDAEQKSITYIPSREASYEQLLEEDWDFPSTDENVDDSAIKGYLIEKLQEALQSLSAEEMVLIHEIYYLEKTERQVCAELNMPKTTLHRRKNKILKKLHRKLEENF